MFVFQFGHTKPPSANHDSRFGYAMPSYFADACINFCRRHVCFRGPPTLNHCCNMPHRNRIFSAAVHFLSVFFFVLFWITVHCRHVLNIRNGTYIARALLRCPFSSTSRSSSEWGNRSFFHFFFIISIRHWYSRPGEIQHGNWWKKTSDPRNHFLLHVNRGTSDTLISIRNNV